MHNIVRYRKIDGSIIEVDWNKVEINERGLLVDANLMADVEIDQHGFPVTVED